MWAQYKKTFVPTQLVIALITCVLYLGNRLLFVAALTFAVMQLGGLAGAAWGLRIGRNAAGSRSAKTEVRA